MAFKQIETWQALPAPPVAHPLLGTPGVRRGAAIATSALVHAGLLWLFATRLVSAPSPEAPFASRPITVLALSGPREDGSEAGKAAKEMRSPPPPVAPPSEIETTAPSPLPPPEWSISRIRVATEATATAPATALAAAGTLGAGMGNGGGGYDPYAGAVPMRRAPASSGRLSYDRALLEGLRSQIIAALPGLSGTADVHVRLSQDGVVIAAAQAGGTAPARAKEMLCHLLLGKKIAAPLAGAATTSALRLPRFAF